MITRAVLRYVRITPRKFRQIIPLVKGKRPEEAVAILTGVKKGASKYGIDVINSAINNARRKCFFIIKLFIFYFFRYAFIIFCS